MVYLRLTSKSDRWLYATISYTWGEKPSLRRQCKNNCPGRPDLTEQSHCAGVSISLFPATLQDAMRIAKRLGFRYLWIDSVCIVQDSIEDWIEQSRVMTHIYAGAVLNISATSSVDSGSGILKPTQHYGVQIGSMVQDGRPEGIIVRQSLGILNLEHTPLATRGWIFQERLVSVATIHYTNQGLVWECGQGVKLDHDQEINPGDWKQQWRAAEYAGPVVSLFNQTLFRDQQKQETLLHWYDWVAAYAARNLFDFNDRLPAIAGLATTLGPKLGMRYAAGLWQEDIISGLMWKRFNRVKSLKRINDDKTPSWSWASVQGRLEYLHKALTTSPKAPNVEVMGSAEVEEETVKSRVRIKSGRIRVKGMLHRVELDKSMHPGVRKRSTQEIGVKSGFINSINVLVTLDRPDSFESDFIRCWCLRLASFEDEGREGDVFLVLEEVEGETQTFRRLGLAETEPWANIWSVMADSGKFAYPECEREHEPKPCELILV